MYIPEAFHIEDEELILEYIKEREFANTFLSNSKTLPIFSIFDECFFP